MQYAELATQLWRGQRGLLIAIGCLLAGNLLVYLFLEQSLLPKVIEQENRYIQRQAEVRQLMRNQGGLDNTPEQLYVLASQDLTTFKEMIPEYQDFTGLIEELLVLSNRAGLNITQINYQVGDLQEVDLLQYSLSFSISGSYEKVKKFVHSLEQSQRLLVIRQISLQGKEGGEVNLRLHLETFFRAERVAS